MRSTLLLSCFCLSPLFALACSGNSGSPTSGDPAPQPTPTLHQLWGATFGGSADARGNGIAEDATGATIVAGTFQGTIAIGTQTLTSNGAEDVFVAKLDPTGAPVWSTSFGDGEVQAAVGVAVDDAGNAVVLGNFGGHFDVGTTHLDGHVGSDDVFLAKLDASGRVLWARGWGDDAIQDGYDVALDHAGNAIHVGGTSGKPDFGTGVLPASGSLDIYVSKVDPSGTVVWARDLGATGQSTCTRGVALDASGNVYITGIFNGSFDWGGGPITSVDGQDIFVVKLDPAGNVVWTKGFGGPNDQIAQSIAIDASGALYLTGSLAGPTDFGAGPTPAGEVLFVAKLDPAGAVAWAKTYAGDTSNGGRSVAVDADGDVLFAGAFRGTLDLGGGAMTHVGAPPYAFDLFLAKVKPADGSLVWAKQGSSAGIGAARLALDGSGGIAVTGGSASSVDLGMPVPATGSGLRPFVVKLGF